MLKKQPRLPFGNITYSDPLIIKTPEIKLNDWENRRCMKCGFLLNKIEDHRNIGLCKYCTNAED